MTQLDTQINDMRLRRGIATQPCSIQGCDEPATDRLPTRMQPPSLLFCQPHAEWLAFEIGRRNYEDLVRRIGGQGITASPRTRDSARGHRLCCVKRCSGEAIGGMVLEPYKPGTAWVCAVHLPAVNFVNERANTMRVLNELLYTPKKQDLEYRRRLRAIRAACVQHLGERNYIRAVCEDLQHQHVHMPDRWIREWQRKGLRVEKSDWFIAYHERIARVVIQKYVSQIARRIPAECDK